MTRPPEKPTWDQADNPCESTREAMQAVLAKAEARLAEALRLGVGVEESMEIMRAAEETAIVLLGGGD